MIEISKIKSSEGPEAVSLILSLFEQFIFPDYSEEGKEAVRGYVSAAGLVADDSENFALVAKLQGSLVGIAKIKKGNHLSMLFVSRLCQGKGHGRRLIEAAISECKVRNPDVTSVTANSSRFALPFFLKHGFQAEEKEKQFNGIRFTPVRMDIVSASQESEPTAASGLDRIKHLE